MSHTSADQSFDDYLFRNEVSCTQPIFSFSFLASIAYHLSYPSRSSNRTRTSYHNKYLDVCGIITRLIHGFSFFFTAPNIFHLTTATIFYYLFYKLLTSFLLHTAQSRIPSPHTPYIEIFSPLTASFDNGCDDFSSC